MPLVTACRNSDFGAADPLDNRAPFSPGLFDHDGLDGDISIGGGQLMSCPQLARSLGASSNGPLRRYAGPTAGTKLNATNQDVTNSACKADSPQQL